MEGLSTSFGPVGRITTLGSLLVRVKWCGFLNSCRFFFSFNLFDDVFKIHYNIYDIYMYYIETQIAQWQSWRDDCLHGNEVLDMFVSVSEIHVHNYVFTLQFWHVMYFVIPHIVLLCIDKAPYKSHYIIMYISKAYLYMQTSVWLWLCRCHVIVMCYKRSIIWDSVAGLVRLIHNSLHPIGSLSPFLTYISGAQRYALYKKRLGFLTFFLAIPDQPPRFQGVFQINGSWRVDSSSPPMPCDGFFQVVA